MKVNFFKNLIIFLFLVFVTEVCYGEKTYLGVTFSIAESDKLPITAVYYNTPAYKYDLRKGDIILKYNDIKVTDYKTYIAYINGMKSGDILKLEILRNNNQITKTIKLENMPNMKPFANVSWKMPGGGNYGVDEEVLLWSSYVENEWVSKNQRYENVKKWKKRIPTLNDSCELKLNKTQLGSLDNYEIYTDGGVITYTPKSHKVVALKFHGESFKGKRCADSRITEKIVDIFCKITNILPKVEFIDEELGNRYIFEYETKPIEYVNIIQPVLNENKDDGNIEIIRTSYAMQEQLKKELAQVEKYVDFNKKERSVPTQLGGYRLGNKPILKRVYDRENGVFEPDGKFPFNNDCITYIYNHHLLDFMRYGESGGFLAYTPISHRITAVSLLYNKFNFNLEKDKAKLPNYIKELLEKDVKEIENRLGLKAIREAEDRYVFNFPSNSKTKLIVDIYKKLNGGAIYYTLMTGEKEFAGNKINYVNGFIQLTLTSEEMESIFIKEKDQLLAEKKVKEEKAKEKKKQQDSAFGLN